MIMEKEMKRGEVFRLFNSIAGILDFCEKESAKADDDKEIVPVKLTYLLLRNKSILQPEIDSMSKAVTFKGDASKLQEFDVKRREIITRYARKDESGNVILNGPNLEIAAANVNTFNSEITELIEEYKEVLEQKQTFDKEVSEFLAGLTKISIYPIEMDLLIDGISPSQLEGIMSILDAAE